MAWHKKYYMNKPYKRVICIDDSNTRLLRKGLKNVIKETETEYLIQFQSGAANWYAKSRFIDIPKPKAKQQPKQQTNTNKLF
jgi:hypothetical protein